MPSRWPVRTCAIPQLAASIPFATAFPSLSAPSPDPTSNTRHSTTASPPATTSRKRLYHWFTRKPSYRDEFISELEIRPQARVLEVSVGTGANLRFLPHDIDFYGVDISWGMLHKCERNLIKCRRKAHLFQAEAERLPFIKPAPSTASSTLAASTSSRTRHAPSKK